MSPELAAPQAKQMRDLKSELLEWEDWPPAWRPWPGDVLVGRVLRYAVGLTPYGKRVAVVVEDDTGDIVSLWLRSPELLDQFRQLKPRVGERIGIRYLGRHPEHVGYQYRVIVDRKEGRRMRNLYRELTGRSKPKRFEYKHWDVISRPGEIIVGRVVKVTTNENTGELRGMIVATDQGKERDVSLGYPHLREQIITLAVKEGDRIGIKYLGQNSRTFHHEFRVLVDR